MTSAPLQANWIDDWNPEDEGFWERTGAKIANRNLWPEYHIDAAGKFLLVSVPTLVGSILRLPYTFAVELRRRPRQHHGRAGGRRQRPGRGNLREARGVRRRADAAGGVLVGDASRYAMLRPLVGSPLPADPVAVIAPGGVELGAEAPDSALVCSCNSVTKGELVATIGTGSLDVAALKARTRAGTSCGSCLPTLKNLLIQEGVEVSRALCEPFRFSRAELFEIVAGAGIRTFSELVARHGTGRGCDICKPAVASILASLGSIDGRVGHIHDGEQAALQETNDHFLANLQRNGTYSVVPRIPGGEVTPAGLIAIGEVARDFGLYTKITGGRRDRPVRRPRRTAARDLAAARRRRVRVGARLRQGFAHGEVVCGHNVVSLRTQDSVGLAVALELGYRGLRPPHKIKSGVSGCARECAEARSKDFGIIATEQGWNLYVGGNGGFSPRQAELLASDADTETLVRLVDRFLMFYIRTADRLQRTAPWIAAMDGGLEYLCAVIVDDALGIGADLEAAMDAHVAGYADEWQGVLGDEEKLGRFVSLVNAPDTPDPTLRFTQVRGQSVPVAVGMPGVRR